MVNVYNSRWRRTCTLVLYNGFLIISWVEKHFQKKATVFGIFVLFRLLRCHYNMSVLGYITTANHVPFSFLLASGCKCGKKCSFCLVACMSETEKREVHINSWPVSLSVCRSRLLDVSCFLSKWAISGEECKWTVWRLAQIEWRELKRRKEEFRILVFV